MINRGNWKLVKNYMAYRRDIDQISEGSLAREYVYLKHLLKWAQEVSFTKAHKIRPAFPEYLLSSRLDDSEAMLSPTSLKKICATARNIFTWMKDNKSGFGHVKHTWIKTMKPRRVPQVQVRREVISFDEIISISKAPVESLKDERARACAVFLYLSGMRISAFVTLPIKAVDLKNKKVQQFPSLGVRTKNGKSQETFLLPIPELLGVVEDWDAKIRKYLDDTAMWFSHLSPVTGGFENDEIEVGKYRASLARNNLKAWLNKVGLPYKNPHAFRHGHIHWGRDHSKDYADFKAISSNVMHSSVGITDAIYSNYRGDELKSKILSLSDNQQKNDLISTLENVLKELKK